MILIIQLKKCNQHSGVEVVTIKEYLEGVNLRILLINFNYKNFFFKILILINPPSEIGQAQKKKSELINPHMKMAHFSPLWGGLLREICYLFVKIYLRNIIRNIKASNIYCIRKLNNFRVFDKFRMVKFNPSTF